MRMLQLASLVIHKGVSLNQILTVFFSVVPTFLEIAIPMSALLGVMLAFARLSADSEIIVIRASGIGLKKLVGPVFVFGLIVSAAGLYVSHELKPWGYKELSESLFEIARSKSTAGLNAGIFNDLGNLTLYAEDIDHKSGKLKHVLIDDRRDPVKHQVITAETGSILSDPAKQEVIFSLRDGDIHEIAEKSYIHTSFINNNLRLRSDDLYGDSVDKTRRSREMYNFEIATELQHWSNMLSNSIEERAEIEQDINLEELSDQRIQKRLSGLMIERDKRLSMPFAALLLALVAMPLGIQPPRTQRTWGAGLSAFIGLLVFVVYYGVLTISLALVEDQKIPVFMGVWLPNIITAIISMIMIQKMGSEKWQSVAQGLLDSFARAGRFISKKAIS